MTMFDVPDAALDELRALYRSLDEEVASLKPTCRRCGLCCDFQRSGLVLYMGPIEAALFFHHTRSLVSPENVVCHFFVNGLCTNRLGRSIGCRTWFCDPALRQPLQDLHEKYLAFTHDLGRRFFIPWGYRPLAGWTERLRSLTSPH